MRLPIVLALALGVAACGHVVPASGPVAPPTPVVVTIPAAAPAPSEPPAPLAIDTDGGIRVELEALDVHVEVHGPLARTELRATFRNRELREVEGRLRLALPPHASLARVAMKVGHDWREAEVAELTAARATYDRFLHRRRDPLLVEQRHEREVTARVAPLASLEQREIVIAFTAEVGADAPVLVPLRGLPRLRTLDVRVDGVGEPVLKHWTATVPEADLRVPVEGAAVRAGSLVAMRVTPVTIPEGERIEGPVVVLVETTASHTGDLGSYARLIETIGAGTDARGSILAYDQTVETLHTGELRGAPIAAKLAARGALGAASLDVGLAEAAKEARRIGARRLILLGGNAPATEGQPLHAELTRAGIERIDVLGVGTHPDARSYRSLIDRPRHGAWIDDATALADATLVGRLQNRVHRNVPIRIEGATWSSIASVDHVSPGEERVVLAQVAPKAKLRVNGETVTPIEDPAAVPTIERAVASSRLDALVTRGARKEAITLAKKHRLASPFTALIVLERDEDSALLREDERAAVPPPSPRPPAPPPKPPMVRMATTIVSGRIPPEVIQRQVRLKIGIFRACVDEATRRNPSVAGRVSVLFVIGSDGRVTHARDAGSEVQDRQLISCMIDGFLTLVLPPPERGFVQVVYPFMVGDPSPPAPMSVPVRPSLGRSPFADPVDAPEEVVLRPWSPTFAELRTRPGELGHTPTSVIALGEALAAKGDLDRAVRAYGSLADLWPERAELLRAAATRIDQLHAGDPLAIALLRRAVADRPDHPSGHHLLGLTLLRAHDEAGARAAFQAGLARGYERRYEGAEDVLRRDVALLEPTVAPSRTLVMTWETDTSDVDLGVTDAKGEPSGGDAFARANDGYGPEALEPAPAGKTLRVKLLRRGLGGDVFGVVHVVKRNERGDVTVEPRPFAIMTERAVLDLGPL